MCEQRLQNYKLQDRRSGLEQTNWVFSRLLTFLHEITDGGTDEGSHTICLTFRMQQFG